MKSYYETHKDLFEAVQKWEENWKLFLELEVLSEQERALPGLVPGHQAVHASAPMCKVLLGKTRKALRNHSGSVRGWGAVSRAPVWFVMGGLRRREASSRVCVPWGVCWLGGVFGSLLTSLLC